MCGIIGFMGQPSTQNYKRVEQLLYLDQTRGEDSTGVVSVCNKIGADFFKTLDKPQDAFKTKDWFSFKRDNPNPFALIGHNRAATRGAITEDNAHPFLHGDTFLVHNGTLKDRALQENNVFGTDSEGVCWNVDTYGAEHTWSKLNGAAVLCWWDDEKRCINLLKNKERPMFFAYTKGKQEVFWASEQWMLDYLKTYCGVVWNKEGIRQPLPDWHISFSFDGNVVSQEQKKLVPFVPPVPPPYVKPVGQGVKKASKNLMRTLGSLIPKKEPGTISLPDSTAHAPGKLSSFWHLVSTKAIKSFSFKNCLSCNAPVESAILPLNTELSLCGKCTNMCREQQMGNLVGGFK